MLSHYVFQTTKLTLCSKMNIMKIRELTIINA